MQHRNPNGLLKLLLVSSVALPVALFATASWFEYRAAFRDAAFDLQRSSQVAREHAAKVFDGQSQIAERVEDLVRGLQIDEIQRSEGALHTTFQSLVGRLPHIQRLLLVGRDGRPLVSSSAYPVSSVMDRGEAKYFKAILDEGSSKYVSDLYKSGAQGGSFFGLGQIWRGSGGDRRGLINVGVAPSFFEDFYKVLVGEGREGFEGTIQSLVRADGQILVRYPAVDSALPRVAASKPFFEMIREHPDHGTYDSVSVVEPGAQTKLFAYSKVGGYPIYAIAGRDRSRITAEWRDTMASHLIFGIPATIALFLVTWTALVRTRREEAALATAKREVEMRKSAEASLLQAQRLEAVGQLTGGVAHDFNNMLTIILSGSELLHRRSSDAARVQKIAEQIALAAKRGSNVTKQLLMFSRNQILHPELIDPNARLRALEPFLDKAAQTPVRISLDLDPSTGLTRVDPGQFEAAILNLVGNARDAIADEGDIFIATRNCELIQPLVDTPSGSYIQITVRDTGSGMTTETVARAFEPFFTTKEVGKGSGLGLSQVYGFAKQAGGNVQIVSALGRGTSVEILLPRAEGIATATPAGCSYTSPLCN